MDYEYIIYHEGKGGRFELTNGRTKKTTIGKKMGYLSKAEFIRTEARISSWEEQKRSVMAISGREISCVDDKSEC
jgi:hypothetical protein